MADQRWPFEKRPDVAARRDEGTLNTLAFDTDGICGDCGCTGRVLTVLLYEPDDPATAVWVVHDPHRAMAWVVDEGWPFNDRGLAAVQYVVCERCSTFWFLGLSVLTAWVHQERAATWQANAALLRRLTYLPDRITRERQRLEGADDV